MSQYSYEVTATAEYETPDVRFVGPGLGGNEVEIAKCDANIVVDLLNAAFEAGRRAKAAEIREVLGVVNPR